MLFLKGVYMLRYLTALLVLVMSSFFLWACQVDTGRMVQAAATLYQGETISNADVAQLGARVAAQHDGESVIAKADNPYAKRLAKITKGLESEDGLNLNFKVYLQDEINAFATPDGSVRVYSGLMDAMTDDELFFVIGHEIGHVKHGHSLAAMRKAYRAAAAVQAIGATHSSAASIADSDLGKIAQSYMQAQFSQAHESQSDVYGVGLLKKYNRPKEAAAASLRKLGNAGGGAFSSHPNPQDRAKAVERM